MKSQRIRLKSVKGNVEVGGWLSGKDTYIWLRGVNTEPDYIEGYLLYRLAKAIVRRWEAKEK
jgi:hypothetical protein